MFGNLHQSVTMLVIVPEKSMNTRSTELLSQDFLSNKHNTFSSSQIGTSNAKNADVPAGGALLSEGAG